MAKRLLVVVAVVAAITLFSSTLRETARAQEAIDPADFSANVTNRFYPLSLVRTLAYEGEETDADTGETIKTRGEVKVLSTTRVVAGVTVLVLQDQNFADGEVVESTLDFFAQHKDGTVYYFGEDVDNYEGGRVVDHHGSWRAGEGKNLPGIFMPAEPAKGASFEQERAPGIAEDRSTVVATGLTVTTPAGTFGSCIETEDVDPLNKATEHKWYCAGVGFVKEDAEGETLELVSYEAPPSPTATVAPAATATAPAGVSRPVVAPNTGAGPDRSGRDNPVLLLLAAGALGLMCAALAGHTARLARERFSRRSG